MKMAVKKVWKSANRHANDLPRSQTPSSNSHGHGPIRTPFKHPAPVGTPPSIQVCDCYNSNITTPFEGHQCLRKQYVKVERVQSLSVKLSKTGKM
jgi:hypothetical protein